MKFQNHFNRDQHPNRVTIVDHSIPSNTIPNQSLTVREIYTRFASGRNLPSRQTQYDDDGNTNHEFTFDDIMPNIQHLDLADKQSILEQAKEQLEEVKKRLDATAKARKQQADQKEADLKRRLKKLEEIDKPTQSGQGTQSGDPLP